MEGLSSGQLPFSKPFPPYKFKTLIPSNPKSNLLFHFPLQSIARFRDFSLFLFFFLLKQFSNGVSSSIVFDSSGEAIAEEELGKSIGGSERTCGGVRRRVSEEAICDSDFVFESSFVSTASQSSRRRVWIWSSRGRFDDSLWRRCVYRSHF